MGCWKGNGRGESKEWQMKGCRKGVKGGSWRKRRGKGEAERRKGREGEWSVKGEELKWGGRSGGKGKERRRWNWRKRGRENGRN